MLGHMAAAMFEFGSVVGRSITKGIDRHGFCWITRYMGLPLGPQSNRAGVRSRAVALSTVTSVDGGPATRGLEGVFPARFPGWEGLQFGLELILKAISGSTVKMEVSGPAARDTERHARAAG